MDIFQAVTRMAEGGVEVPVLPVALAFTGLIAVAAISLSALRAPRRVSRPAVIASAPARAPAPAPAPTPVAVAPQYKRAPISLHFPAIRSDYPDVWGVREPFEILIRLEDKTLQPLRQVPGLTLQVDGATYTPVFTQGVATVRHTFPSLGEKPVQINLRVKNEPLPRRNQRPVKVVDYRTEIAEVFANFREEASRAITPIREDATPWEIYDLLTSANANLPADQLRDIVSSYEEAKFSNHPVTRATYERMIHALLELERVEL